MPPRITSQIHTAELWQKKKTEIRNREEEQKTRNIWTIRPTYNVGHSATDSFLDIRRTKPIFPDLEADNPSPNRCSFYRDSW